MFLNIWFCLSFYNLVFLQQNLPVTSQYHEIMVFTIPFIPPKKASFSEDPLLPNYFTITELVLASYYVLHPHAVVFVRNNIPYPLLKPSKPHTVQGGVAFQMPQFGKIRGKNHNCALLLDFLALFLVTPRTCPYFKE